MKRKLLKPAAMSRKFAAWCFLLVLINFTIESVAEYFSEMTRQNSLDYGLYEEPAFKWFTDILGAKLLFWTLPYFLLYYRFLIRSGKAQIRRKTRFAIFNLFSFWICVMIYLPFFPDIIVNRLNLNQPPSLLSKWLHSSIVALVSGYLVGFLYILIRERYLNEYGNPPVSESIRT